jgi:magnesium-transporting ATPase (P-type)
VDDRRELLSGLRRLGVLAALSQNDRGKNNELMDMDAASKVRSLSDSTWHAMTADEVITRLGTSATKGLDAEEIASRLQKYGSNRLPEGAKRGPFMRFLSQFNNILVYVLLGAGFTKLMLNLWLDATIIFGVVVLNGLLGFIQEGRAEKALDSIRNMLSAEARTVRGGETRMIAADQLVPGDLVLLESGDKVPADLRLTEVNNFRTEEAALTGESVPAEKTTHVVAVNATVGDRECMAFSGTMVVSGRATGVVVATGSETELGRINQLLASVSTLETPLLRQIKQFGYAITAVIGVVGVLVFAYGKMGEGHGLRGDFPGGRRHRRIGHSRRLAGTHYHYACHRCAAHGAAQCNHPAPPRG